MTLWLILLLVWLAGIPAAIVSTAVLSSQWHEWRRQRLPVPRQGRRAWLALSARELDCGGRVHGLRLRAWNARRGFRRVPGRRHA
jgi:hypothetical protein